jgi:ubiquinone biosynthesis protein COQ4
MPSTRATTIQPRRAFRAARALAANPDDLPQVFTVIEALSGDTVGRVYRRMTRTESGRRLLADRPDIVDRLSDRQALAQLPVGSLGRAYLAFVERENISPEGIRSAGEKGMTHVDALPPELEYVHARMRDTHDLWHAAVGYGGDVLGETALLAFTFAQSWNPAIALILGVGLLKTIGAPHARRVILDGFRRGRKAAWLPAQEWEAMLALPVDEVRRRLSLEAAPVYAPIRTADLRAAGVVG